MTENSNDPLGNYIVAPINDFFDDKDFLTKTLSGRGDKKKQLSTEKLKSLVGKFFLQFITCN